MSDYLMLITLGITILWTIILQFSFKKLKKENLTLHQTLEIQKNLNSKRSEVVYLCMEKLYPLVDKTGFKEFWRSSASAVYGSDEIWSDMCHDNFVKTLEKDKNV